MRPEEAKSIARMVLGSWPQQRLRMTDDDVAGMVGAYALALAHLDYSAVKAAVAELVLTEQWMPTVATIVAKVSAQQEGRARKGGDAWGDVLAAMRRYGSHRTPGLDFEFADPIVARVVKAFGWRDLCASENATADRARFIDLYDQLSAEAATDRAVARALPGGTPKQLPRGTVSIGAAIAKALPRGGES